MRSEVHPSLHWPTSVITACLDGTSHESASLQCSRKRRPQAVLERELAAVSSTSLPAAAMVVVGPEDVLSPLHLSTAVTM